MNAGLFPGDPPQTNCGAGSQGGREAKQWQPRKQGNSMEEITQDVAIQTKMQMQ